MCCQILKVSSEQTSFDPQIASCTEVLEEQEDHSLPPDLPEPFHEDRLWGEEQDQLCFPGEHPGDSLLR